MKYQKGNFIVVPNIELLKGQNPIMQTLYMWMCKYSNEEGVCFPSLKTLSLDVGISRRTIINYIRELELLGIIKKENRFNKNEQISNIYYINLPSEPNALPSEPNALPSEPNAPRTISNELYPTNSSILLSEKIVNIPTDIEKIYNYWQLIKEKDIYWKGNRKLDDNIKKILVNIFKNYSKDDIEIGMKNYINDTVNRKQDDRGYYKHRFSLQEFFTQKNGFIKFYNITN